MSRIVVTEFVTLDGVMEDPGGAEGFERGGWAFQFDRGPEGDKFKLDEVMAAEALLLGRVTYEGFAAAWPSRTGEFADKFNTMPKYVVSTTLEHPDWSNSTVIGGDVANEVARLREQPGGDVLVNGSARLVATLMEHDLVDEYRLMVFPVVLGRGKRLFADGAPRKPLELVETKPAGAVVILTLRPLKPETEGEHVDH
jgi:dihydrofolate reductase